MKTNKAIPQDEVLARMQNWILANIKITIDDLTEAMNKIKYSTKGQAALIDLAYYIQWAYLKKLEYIEILEAVFLDLYKGHQPEYKMISFGCKDAYMHHTKHISKDELSEVKEVAIISAILSDHFSKALLAKRQSYIATMEQLAEASQTVYYNQSLKPHEMDWMEYVEQFDLASWDEWVLEQGAKVLQLNKAA